MKDLKVEIKSEFLIKEEVPDDVVPEPVSLDQEPKRKPAKKGI
jgi:hypothetical protein